MEKRECMFVTEKETKRTWRMQEVSTASGAPKPSEDPVIGTLYLRKSKYPVDPKKVKVTVEVLE